MNDEPNDLGTNDIQALHTAHINPFAATLIAESFGMIAPVEHWLEAVRFKVVIKNGREVEVTLRDATVRVKP